MSVATSTTSISSRLRPRLERPSCREFNKVVGGSPEHGQFPALSYSGDFRTEEEVGASALRRAIVGDDPTSICVRPERLDQLGVFSDVNGIIIADRKLNEPNPRWGEDIHGNRGVEYTSFWERRDPLHWVTRELGREKIAELRTLGRSYGLEGALGGSKDEIIARICTETSYLDESVALGAKPGWFHHGNVLILRAESGPAAEMITHLIKAIGEASLGIAGKSLGLEGIGIYDARDVPEALLVARAAEAAWVESEEKLLEPVKAELTRRGLRWFFLGKPSRSGSDGQTRYWLNPYEQHTNNAGWFTREELLAEHYRKS